jgi:hypothetical protein
MCLVVKICTKTFGGGGDGLGQFVSPLEAAYCNWKALVHISLSGMINLRLWEIAGPSGELASDC